MKLQTLTGFLDELAPRHLAEDWDNIGLQVGDPQIEVRRVLVALDCTGSVVEEALTSGTNIIITHHPLIFRALKNLRLDTAPGNILAKLIKNDIAVFAAHTNLDSATGGVNTILAQKLGLLEPAILSPGHEEKLYKIVVFVPRGHEDQVREAMGRAGAGWIGNYSDCFFMLPGIGTFKAGEGTDPFIGEIGRLEKVEEYRLETIVPAPKLRQVIAAMNKAHPYEEVAYDLVPLANEGTKAGLGRVGNLPTVLELGALAGKVKQALNLQQLRLVGDPARAVQKIAVCGGSGASLIRAAVAKGADVLVTGDLKYHEAQEALELGLAVIDAGHFATENIVIQTVVEFLQTKIAKTKENIPVLAAQTTFDPFKFL